MVKHLLLLLQIFYVGLAVSARIPSRNDYVRLGSFKSQKQINGRMVYLEDEYYVSTLNSNWAAASSDCTYVFEDPKAGLVAIESEEEWNFLKIMLEPYGIPTYWTSGMHDAGTSTWRWVTSNQPLPPKPWAPWADGYPANPTATLRVLLTHSNRFSASWRTALSSQMHRSICEVPRPPTEAVNCYKENDLVVVLDSSGSIGYDNFEIAKQFVAKLANAFTIYSRNRLSLISYSANVRVVVPLTNTYSRSQIESLILNDRWQDDTTATDLGINAAIGQFKSVPKNVPLNMVVLTDGESDDKDRTIVAANSALDMGVRSFAVGITSSINHDELLAIAGGNSSRVFNSANFHELIEILAPLSVIVCPD